MKVIFTGGGTGGHIYPIIAIVREVKRAYSNQKKKLDLFYIGPKDKLSLTLLSQEGIKVKTVLAGKIRRYFGVRAFFQNLIDPFKILIGILQSFHRLFYLAPDLVFSKGGYGSFPVVFAAKLLRIPIFLHETDAIFGLANKTMSKFSDEVFVSFPDTENADASKMILVGNTVRRELLEGSAKGKFSDEVFVSFPDAENADASKMILVGNTVRRELLEGSAEDARKLFSITSDKPVVLIIGGSQGAQRINNLILSILPQLLKEFEIIHQTGPKNFEKVKAEAGAVMTKESEIFYHPVPYLEEIKLKHVYKLSDFIVSRAGSGSIFEIAILGKPSILIPLAGSAQNHQVKNAYAYAKNKAAMVIEEGNLTPHFFLAVLKNTLADTKQLEAMKKAAQEFSRPRAGEIIANYIIEYLTQ